MSPGPCRGRPAPIVLRLITLHHSDDIGQFGAARHMDKERRQHQYMSHLLLDFSFTVEANQTPTFASRSNPSCTTFDSIRRVFDGHDKFSQGRRFHSKRQTNTTKLSSSMNWTRRMRACTSGCRHMMTRIPAPKLPGDGRI